MPTDADVEAVARAKQTLREAVALRREVRPAAERTRDDEARLAVLTRALAGQLPRTVAAYLSSGTEPGTLQLIAWLAAHDVRVLLPVLSQGREPAWAPYGGRDALRPGRHGILEPAAAPLPDGGLTEAGLVLAPALAANRQGDRLGRGGGWYDRALAHAGPGVPVWVLLNSDEVLDVIPVHSWDRPVNALVTPAALLSTTAA